MKPKFLHSNVGFYFPFIFFFPPLSSFPIRKTTFLLDFLPCNVCHYSLIEKRKKVTNEERADKHFFLENCNQAKCSTLFSNYSSFLPFCLKVKNLNFLMHFEDIWSFFLFRTDLTPKPYIFSSLLSLCLEKHFQQLPRD